MQALKEIQKYKKGADLLIWRVPFQRLVREIVQKRRKGLKLQKLSSISIARSWRGNSGGAFGASKHVCYTCQMCDHYVKGHTASTQNPGEFLNRSQGLKLIKDNYMLISESIKREPIVSL